MKPAPTESPASTYLGHVKNGVIILDTHISLTEGQPVRVEPLREEVATPITDERSEQLARMKALFAQWDEEDRTLSDDEADRLEQALHQNRGLSLRVHHGE